jgi:HTH-type transcriptional regulator, sugar sensing transcriptional regulator
MAIIHYLCSEYVIAVDKASQLLQELGLSLNEARAYAALLSCQPASAYEVAKQSAIPTSKIYETLGKLVVRGIARPTETTADLGKQYVALPPADFLTQIRTASERNANALQPLLESLTTHPTHELIWSLTSAAQIEARALELVGAANDSILISAWPQELAWIGEPITEAAARGVKIALVHFGRPEFQVGATYHHPVEKTLYQEKGGRGLTLVADSQAVLIANFRANGVVDGAWSRNQCFVTVAEDYVKHDVYITKVTRFLDAAVVERFGREYEKLRDVFNADA